MPNDKIHVDPKSAKLDPTTIKPKDLFETPDLSLLLANKIEGQFYERKSKQTAKRIAQIVSSFANENILGGIISIGISDNGDIDGILNRSDLNINEVLRFQHQVGVLTDHKFINCKNHQGKDDQILLIYVPYVDNRVVETSDGKAFIRIGEETVQLSYDKRRELEYKKGQKSFEDEVGCEFDEKELTEDVLKEFIDSVRKKDKHQLSHPIEDILYNCHLIKKENGKKYLTKAGLVLFSKNPRSNIPGAYLRFLKYQGRERKTGATHNLIKDETFSGPLPKLIQKAIDYIKTQVKEFSYLSEKGKFVTEPEYPEFAWTEAIVNALIHRSYSIVNSPVFVEMYDDRIEVKSPGDYPVGVTPDQFFHNPRNPHLMDAMRYLEFVKMASEGVPRIKQEMKEAGLPEPVFSHPGQPYVRVILKNDIERREERIKSEKDEITEYSNLFELNVTGPSGSESAIIEGKGEGLTPKEIREALCNNLISSGWAIDSFTKATAINLRKKYQVEEIDKFISIYPGFKFRIRRIKNHIVLLIDPTIEVRSKITLSTLKNIAPEILDWGLYKGYVKIRSKWKPSIIKNFDKSKVYVQFKENEKEKKVSLDDVVPALSIGKISYFLKSANVKVNIYKVIQKFSFSSSKNASRLRANETTRIAEKLSKEIFPILVDDFRVDINTKPLDIRPNFELFDDLTEIEPIFNEKNPQSSPSIINGLSDFGSYQRPEEEIPIVILCTEDNVRNMQSLMRTVIQGSHKYKGLEKTFALSLKPIVTEVADSFDDYLNKCKRLVNEVHENSIFIIHCPESAYSREDYTSPYYQTKHFLLEKGFPSQMVDDKTLLDPKFKDFNFALDVFAKSGFIPWVLSEGMPNADLFLGISYSSIGRGTDRERILSYINVFDRYGKWLYYRGSARPIKFEERNEEFNKILDEIVQDYETRASLHRLHIHHGFRLSHESRKEIAKGVWDRAPQAEVSFAYINTDSHVRLYDKKSVGDGSLSRGSYVVIDPNHFFISTTGYNYLGQKGIGTPRTLEININRLGSKGEIDPRIYAQHVLSLTKLNWASTKNFCREPITIKYSKDIAYLMAAFLKGFGSFKIHPKLEKTPWFL